MAGEKILLVEDEITLRRSLSLALAKNGYRVFGSRDADEAIDIFEREGKFDLVFCDVALRGQNGVQLIEKLIAKAPGLKVVFTSGYIDIEPQWREIKKKGYKFLQKPYDLPELLLAVRETLTVKL